MVGKKDDTRATALGIHKFPVQSKDLGRACMVSDHHHPYHEPEGIEDKFTESRFGQVRVAKHILLGLLVPHPRP